MAKGTSILIDSIYIFCVIGFYNYFEYPAKTIACFPSKDQVFLG